MLRRALFSGLLLAFSLLPAFGDAGDLDATWGGTGKVVTEINNADDASFRVLVKPDGKILSGGYAFDGSVNRFCLMQFNPDGTPDTAFGAGGRALLSLGNIGGFSDAILLTDGKILAVGADILFVGGDASTRLAIARLNADGSVDASFASGGLAVVDLPTSFESLRSAAVQADGRIVVCGMAQSGAYSSPLLARFTADGALDPSFSDDGWVMTDLGEFGYAAVVRVQADGKLAVAGSILLRYNADGSLDSSFDGDGMLSLQVGEGSNWTDLEVLPDGKLLVAGSAARTNDDGYLESDMAVARVTPTGALDPSFGGGAGYATIDGDAASDSDGANDLALQADGKLVVAGLTNDFVDAQTDHTIVARLTADGTPDPTFDSNGKTVVALSALSDAALSVAIQADGRIVTGGQTHNGNSYDAVFLRFNTNGNLHAGWGGNGKVFASPSMTDDFATACALQADGRLVVAGFSGPPLASGYTAGVLTRYRTDGTLDESFGSGGRVLTDAANQSLFFRAVAIQSDGRIVAIGEWSGLRRFLPSGAPDPEPLGGVSFGGTNDEPRAMVIQPDGAIVVAGWTNEFVEGTGLTQRFGLSRALLDGNTDLYVRTAVGTGHAAANALALQSDGKFVLAGWAQNGTDYDFALVRYNSDGSLDPSFDGDGVVTTNLGSASEGIQAMVIQSDGRILVAGVSGDDFALARYNENGTLDTSFDGDGRVITSFGAGPDVATGIAVRSQRIVVGGFSWNGANYDFSVARYHMSGALDTSFSTDGKATTDIRGGDDRAVALAVQANGRVLIVGTSAGGADTAFGIVRYQWQ